MSFNMKSNIMTIQSFVRRQASRGILALLVLAMILSPSLIKDSKVFSKAKFEETSLMNKDVLGSNDAMVNTAREMRRRSEVIKRLCREKGHSSSGGLYYLSKNKSFMQRVNTQMAVDARNSQSLFCVNFKVGSTNWLRVYAQLTADRVNASKAALDHHFYHVILPEIGVRNARAALGLFASGAFFTFMSVRHPLDRLLSAYRDRILDGSTWQSKSFVPRILDENKVFDKEGKVKIFPSFEQFLRFVATDSNSDPHWRSFTSNCAPCLLHYDAVIKLESSEEDERFVLEKSGMIAAGVDLGKRHVTKGGKSEGARAKFYSNVTCNTLKAVVHAYEADFELFEYDPKPFFQWCSLEH